MQLEITEADENIIERISKKEYLGLATTDQDDNRVEALLNKLNNWKLLRVTSFIQRFIYNCTKTHSKITGPLTTDEILNAEISARLNTTENQHGTETRW